MKKHHYLYACASLILFFLGTAYAGWQVDYQINGDDLFMSVFAVTDQVVYAVGMTDMRPSQGGCLYGTTDGGQTWDWKGPTTFNFLMNDVDFISESMGWMVGMESIVPQIYYTQDGGNSLFKQRPPAAEFGALMDVDFVDSQRGWAVGDGGMIFVTHDSGFNWSTQTSPFTIRNEGLFMLNEQEGWITGGDFDSSRLANYFLNIAFPFSARLSIAPASVYDGFVLHTSNGGNTWEVQVSGLPYHLTGIHFADDQHGWVVGEGNTDACILATKDGGQTWNPQTVPQHSNGAIVHLSDVHFSDPLNGWAAGYGSVMGYPFAAIVKTNTGGITWTTDESFQGYILLMDVHFPEGRNDVGWAVGSGPTILKYNAGPSMDTTPPIAINHDPAPGEMNVRPDTHIYVEFIDGQSGVDPGSIEMKVNGNLMAPSPNGITGGYSIEYSPTTAFNPGEEVVVSLDACDLAPSANCMATETYTFTISNMPIDKAPPRIVDFQPQAGSTCVPINAPINIVIEDDIAGVDLNSVTVDIDGTVYDKHSPEMTVRGDTSSYRITVQPAQDFPANADITVKITGCDLYLVPNCMNAPVITFSTASGVAIPEIWLGGYYNTRLSTAGGGFISLMAYIPTMSVTEVEIMAAGQPTGLYMKDDGLNGDLAAGDRIYTFHMPNLSPGIRRGRYLLEIVARDNRGNVSLPWPYLNITQVPTRAYGLYLAKPELIPYETLYHHTVTKSAMGPGAPSIMFGGYWDSAISTIQGGQMTLLMICSDPQGLADIAQVELYYNGEATGALLRDDGQSGDMAAGDGVYGLSTGFGSGTPAGRYLLEAMATDNLGNQSVLWPYLGVE